MKKFKKCLKMIFHYPLDGFMFYFLLGNYVVAILCFLSGNPHFALKFIFFGIFSLVSKILLDKLLL